MGSSSGQPSPHISCFRLRGNYVLQLPPVFTSISWFRLWDLWAPVVVSIYFIPPASDYGVTVCSSCRQYSPLFPGSDCGTCGLQYGQHSPHTSCFRLRGNCVLQLPPVFTSISWFRLWDLWAPVVVSIHLIHPDSDYGVTVCSSCLQYSPLFPGSGCGTCGLQ